MIMHVVIYVNMDVSLQH